MNSPSRPITAALVAAAAAAALVAAWLIPVSPARVAGTPTAPPREALSLPAVPPLADLKQTVARPLFSPTRRPPPTAGAGEATPPTVVALFNRYRLQGVVIDGSRRRVLLAPTPGGPTLSVGEGESVDGWTIERIAPERLTLRSGDRVETVDLGTARYR